MIISSKILNASYTVNELTQGMAEQILDKMEEIKDLTGLRFQTGYLAIAREIGWIEAPEISTLPRRHVVWIFRKLTDIWEEANTLPND